jgi:hypothetical protein
LGKREEDHVKYQPSAMPSSFKGVTSFDMMAYVRGRLTKITPETSLSVAKKYLRDASFALFMDRARNGIVKSNSKDLIPHYEAILGGKVNEDVLSRLREIMYDLKGIIPDKGKEEGIAQRFKATFALYKAGGIGFKKG